MFTSRLEFFVVALLAVLGGLFLGVPRFDGFNTGDAGTVPAVSNQETTDAPNVNDASPSQAPSATTTRFDGTSAIIAGQATPNASVVAMSAGTELARTTADQDGNYALSFGYTPPAEGGVLQLAEINANGELVPAEEAITVLPQSEGETVTATLTEDGVEVEAPANQDLALTQMQYGASAPWVLSGSAKAGATIDLTINGEPLAEVTADENGEWRYEGESPAPGTYQLAMSEDGSETVAQELTIQEEAPSTETETAGTEADATTESAQSVTVGQREYTVQRGDSLWRIAERVFGEGQGERYVEIFDVNASQIRNPDLIYPEQNLDLPKD